jgi:hypothetical protein
MKFHQIYGISGDIHQKRSSEGGLNWEKGLGEMVDE